MGTKKRQPANCHACGCTLLALATTWPLSGSVKDRVDRCDHVGATLGAMNRKMRRAEKLQSVRGGALDARIKRGRPGSTPGSLASLFSEAVRCLQSRQSARALALCDRILSLRPGLAEAHSSRGVALLGLDRIADAEAAFRQAIALKVDFVDAYNNLGIVLCRLGRPADAEGVLRQAIRLKPECAHAYSNLGSALKSQSRFDEAEAAFRQAIALNPDLADAYSNLGNTLQALGRRDDAETALHRAIALRPQFADAFTNLGHALREQGRLGEAEAACRRAIELAPFHPEAHCILGVTLEGQGRLIEAEATFRRAIALKHGYAEAYNNLGAILRTLGRLAEAQVAFEQAIQLGSQNTLYLLNLTDVRHFTASDPYLAAMEKAAQNIASLPVKQQIELHFALAKAHEDIGQHDNSFQQLLAGNALKRRQIPYDEIAQLGAFERIRTVFTPELIKKFRDIGETSPAPLFIVGMPRSGTTLIEQIMAGHPEVFAAGELPNFQNAAASLRPTRSDIFQYPDVMLHVSGEQLQRLGTQYATEIVRLAPTATHVIDKMPSNFFHIGLIHLALPNARIIHAVRNPVDTCVSCFSKLFAAGQYHTYDLAELGRYYRQYQLLMEHWHHVLPPGRILEVRYENIVADLEGQARQIFAHCGLEWHARCLAFHEVQRPVSTASAIQVRQPLYRTAIGRARTYESFLQPLLTELFGNIVGMQAA